MSVFGNHAEQLLGTIVEQAPEAIYVVDATSRHLVRANPAFQRLLGYPAEEIPSLTIYDFVNDRRDRIGARFSRALMSETPIRGDRLYRRKDGSAICVDTSAFRLRCPGPQLVCTVARDVTDHRQMETQIRWYRDQLRHLTSQLYLAEQRERRRIARILHDQAGQLLTTAILKLDELVTPAPPAPPAIAPGLEQISQLLRDVSLELRSLTLELSPPVLHDRGIAKAVQWLAEKFEAESGLRVRVEIGHITQTLGEELSTMLFQSLRELLNNALKHAHAKTVEVTLKSDHAEVIMVVKDDGLGFDPATKFDPGVERLGGFGLFSIGQRLTHLGGRLEITSAPGTGAQISMFIPVEAREYAHG